MRALAITVLVCGVAAAEPMPSGAIGVVTGGIAGTGPDAARVGAGVYAFGAQASWQPTTTENHLGWTIRWSTMFGKMSVGVVSIDSQPPTAIRMAITTKVYGRRNARRTIHIGPQFAPNRQNGEGSDVD
jgi:hypothetical protein